MHIPHPCVSLKYGMHLSKSTYHFSIPRTEFFSRLMASGGHAVVQIWQFVQKSSAPNTSGASVVSGMSVNTPASRKDDPNCQLMIEPCLPSSPMPASMAAGISNIGPAAGPPWGRAE